MKKIIFSIATLLSFVAVFAITMAQNWAITDKYSIQFSNNGVSGIFKKFSGTIVFDEKNPGASRFDVTIDPASINTGNGLQNKHAKGEEWFNVAKYPAIRYTSSKIVKSGNGYQVTGTLEMRGVKKEVAIPFTFQQSGNGGTFKGAFSVNRNDFKIGEPGGDVDAMIKVEVTVPVVKK